MKNTLKTQHEVNFKYGSFLNYKAFKDYHVTNKISDAYFNKNHCVIMAFIVDDFRKTKTIPDITIENEKYVLMNSNYILNNLIYLKIKKSQLKKYLILKYRLLNFVLLKFLYQYYLILFEDYYLYQYIVNYHPY